MTRYTSFKRRYEKLIVRVTTSTIMVDLRHGETLARVRFKFSVYRYIPRSYKLTRNKIIVVRILSIYCTYTKRLYATIFPGLRTYT